MATDGQNSKPLTYAQKRRATEERKKKASFKQRVNWRKFRITGAASFADGALGSSINRLQALMWELPIGHHLRYDIARTIHKLKSVTWEINQYRNSAIDLAEEAESQLKASEEGDCYGTSNLSGS